MTLAARRMRQEDLARRRLRLWLKLLRSTRRVERAVRDRLRAEAGTTLPRFDVMAALYREEAGLRMSELSRRLMVSNGNVTGIVDRLVADGMITRAPVAGDRRASAVRLTARGRAAFESMAARHQQWIDELFEGLSAAEIDTVAAGLEKIAISRETEQ